MRLSKTVVGPILDAVGSFTVDMGEFGAVVVDTPSSLLNGTAASGQAVIPLTSSNGFVVGMTVTIKDSAGTETGTITTVTPATPSITLSANLANTYTVARGAFVVGQTGVTLPLTGDAAASQATILLAGNTAGFAVGQLVLIKDTLNFETGWVITVNGGASIVLGVNLSHAYAVARGATVQVMSTSNQRCGVSMSQFTFTTNAFLALKWAVAQNVVTVQVMKATTADQANVVVWGYAASADVAGALFHVSFDGE